MQEAEFVDAEMLAGVNDGVGGWFFDDHRAIGFETGGQKVAFENACFMAAVFTEMYRA